MSTPRAPLFFLLSLAALLFMAVGGAAIGAVLTRPLPATRLDAEPAWRGPQFIQADHKGNVSLLRGDTLDVYPVDSGGKIGEPTRLRRGGVIDETISDAALSGDGDRWVLVAGSEVLCFEDGRERSTPELGWIATSVGTRGDDVLASVVPIQVNVAPGTSASRVPPLVLSLEGQRWSTAVKGTLPRHYEGRALMNTMFADHSARLASSRDGRLWVAHPFSGRVVRFTSAGRAELEIVIGDGSPSYRDDEERLQRDLEREAAKRYPGGTQAVAFTAKLAILGFTAASDGTLYLLLPADGGSVASLARWDPVRSVVETVPVAVKPQGKVTMAAGRDGLYIAGETGSSGRWRISWEALDAAPWTERADIRIK